MSQEELIELMIEQLHAYQNQAVFNLSCYLSIMNLIKELETNLKQDFQIYYKEVTKALNI